MCLSSGKGNVCTNSYCGRHLTTIQTITLLDHFTPPLQSFMIMNRNDEMVLSSSPHFPLIDSGYLHVLKPPQPYFLDGVLLGSLSEAELAAAPVFDRSLSSAALVRSLVRSLKSAMLWSILTFISSPESGSAAASRQDLSTKAVHGAAWPLVGTTAVHVSSFLSAIPALEQKSVSQVLPFGKSTEGYQPYPESSSLASLSESAIWELSAMMLYCDVVVLG